MRVLPHASGRPCDPAGPPPSAPPASGSRDPHAGAGRVGVGARGATNYCSTSAISPPTATPMSAPAAPPVPLAKRRAPGSREFSPHDFGAGLEVDSQEVLALAGAPSCAASRDGGRRTPIARPAKRSARPTPGPVPKTFVLDTNVILHDSQCLRSFAEHDVAVPMTVLEELDRFKKGGGGEALSRPAVPAGTGRADRRTALHRRHSPGRTPRPGAGRPRPPGRPGPAGRVHRGHPRSPHPRRRAGGAPGGGRPEHPRRRTSAGRDRHQGHQPSHEGEGAGA